MKITTAVTSSTTMTTTVMMTAMFSLGAAGHTSSNALHSASAAYANRCSISLTHQLLHHIRLMAFFPKTTWISRHQKGKPFWILMEREMMGWQWHQLDHMQIICTSLQTDNHASTSPLNFYRPDALPAAQPTASKH